MLIVCLWTREAFGGLLSGTEESRGETSPSKRDIKSQVSSGVINLVGLALCYRLFDPSNFIFLLFLVVVFCSSQNETMCQLSPGQALQPIAGPEKRFSSLIKGPDSTCPDALRPAAQPQQQAPQADMLPVKFFWHCRLEYLGCMGKMDKLTEQEPLAPQFQECEQAKVTGQPPAKKSRTNTPWTAAEEHRLKQMRGAGNSWAEIAKVCCRKPLLMIRVHPANTF
ncbi:hypothetical protein B0T20DRAFT_2420 [Sordaria brevicollis]|uniref:Myb-like domain-containing protein n=1 Tax=Sordaria brevicollis TaxID=83679 RepID=A0AAE0PMK6_SORBR|nr:hypothetical protein B0T20DRAFT_2420 [Sordaria brevicollis]